MIKKQMGYGLLLLLLVGCPLVAALSPGTKVALGYRPVLNDQHTLVLTVETTVLQSVAAYQVMREQTSIFQLGCQVVQVNQAGQGVMKVTFQNIRVALRTPLEKLEVSSAKPSATTQSVLDLTGRSFLIRFSPKEVISDGKLDQRLTIVDPFAINPVIHWNDSIAALLASIFNLPYPGPVGIKESWKKNLVLPSADCPIPVEVGLQLLEVKDNLGVVNLFGPIKHSVKNSLSIRTNTKDNLIIDQTTTLTGTTQGAVNYRLKDGWIERANLVSTLVGEVRRLDNAIPVTVTMKIKLETKTAQ